ncbi:MAG: HD domain-containing phosphohydrolase [Pseudomonadota bacterium]
MKKTVLIDELSVGMILTRVVESSSNLQVKSQGEIKSQRTIDNLKDRGVTKVEIKVREVCANLTNREKSTPVIRSFDDQQKDLAAADALYSQARTVHTRFLTELRSGEAPNIDQVTNLTQDIIDSVFENQEALSCLVMLKERDENLAQNSLNCSILLSIFAVHLGMSQSEVEDITLAGLLMDIGMALLPADVVKADYHSLTEADLNVFKTHVEIGLELIERYFDLPPLVEDVIRHHHERIDGSGYPKGESQSSQAAQMASIVDTYNTLVSRDANGFAGNTQAVLEQMQKEPGFDETLVNDFIEAIGLFPVGTLVQLKSNKLAIVVQSNNRSLLHPKVMAFYHIKNKHYIPIKIIDLKRKTDKISVAVRPEEFNINLPKFFRTAVMPG